MIERKKFIEFSWRNKKQFFLNNFKIQYLFWVISLSFWNYFIIILIIIFINIHNNVMIIIKIVNAKSHIIQMIQKIYHMPKISGVIIPHSLISTDLSTSHILYIFNKYSFRCTCFSIGSLNWNWLRFLAICKLIPYNFFIFCFFYMLFVWWLSGPIC